MKDLASFTFTFLVFFKEKKQLNNWKVIYANENDVTFMTTQ